MNIFDIWFCTQHHKAKGDPRWDGNEDIALGILVSTALLFMSMIIVYELNIQVHHPAWGVLIMALLYIIPTACSLIRYRNKHRRNELYNKSHLYYRQHKRKCNRIYWGSWLFPFLLFALWIVSLLLRQ